MCNLGLYKCTALLPTFSLNFAYFCLMQKSLQTKLDHVTACINSKDELALCELIFHSTIC